MTGAEVFGLIVFVILVAVLLLWIDWEQKQHAKHVEACRWDGQEDRRRHRKIHV